jgi:hypothetical protein
MIMLGGRIPSLSSLHPPKEEKKHLACEQMDGL